MDRRRGLSDGPCPRARGSTRRFFLSGRGTRSFPKEENEDSHWVRLGTPPSTYGQGRVRRSLRETGVQEVTSDEVSVREGRYRCVSVRPGEGTWSNVSSRRERSRRSTGDDCSGTTQYNPQTRSVLPGRDRPGLPRRCGSPFRSLFGNVRLETSLDLRLW